MVVLALPMRCNALTCCWYSESNFFCCALFMKPFLLLSCSGVEHVEELLFMAGFLYFCRRAASFNKAFEQWRYLYEYDGIGTELQSIRYTMHVSHEACCRVRECIKKT